MPIHLSFKDLPKSGLPTEGAWPAVVKQAFLEPNKSKDSFNVRVIFEFTGSDYAGKTITNWFSLKIADAVYKLFVNLGVIKEGDDLDLVENPQSLALVKPNIINKPCLLLMGEQEDSDYSEIKEVLPYNATAATSKTEVLEKRATLR